MTNEETTPEVVAEVANQNNEAAASEAPQEGEKPSEATEVAEQSPDAPAASPEAPAATDTTEG